MTATAPSRAEVSRREILDTAARLLRTRGLAETSLRDLAEEVGMKAGSLYYHFSSKEEIVAEVLRVGIETVHEAVARAVRGARGPDVLRAAIRAHLTTLLLLGDYTSANVRIFGHVPPEVRRQNMPVRDRYDALWDGILEGAQTAGVLAPDVDLKTFRLFLIGAMNGVLEWYRPGKKSVAVLADELTDIALLGVAKHRRRRGALRRIGR